jgi:hypothetical protein
MFSPHPMKEHPMSLTPDLIVQQMHTDFQSLITYVRDAEARTAAEVEYTLFRRLLALGLQLLRLFFLTRAAMRPSSPPTTATGAPLPAHDRRSIDYLSVFGKLSFARQYFYTAGIAGICPLDADLSLPARCYSDLLRDWMAYDITDSAYRETTTTVRRILGLDLSVQSLERVMADDACDVTAFYDQLPSQAPSPLGSIVVAQADGKGVPMVQPALPSTPVRLGKGQKRTKKKEAIVTALYTIAPYPRTPQEVLAALMHEPREADPAQRPRPEQKELRATLEGKTVAVSRLAERARLRDGAHIQDRVALTDGAEALQEQMQAQLPHYTLVLDIIHATEYLWETATALVGETNPLRNVWVRGHLERLLTGQTAAVLTALEEGIEQPGRTATQIAALRKTKGYYQRNLPFMHYDLYLARGWPIGTGVVEGACGHVVKDRMEQAGMRWTKEGAQALLDLRAVRLNGDWDAYWQFHRHKEHERLYGNKRSVCACAEGQVLQAAA